MLDRTQSPEIQEISNLKLLLPELVHLDNGIPVYITNKGTQNIVKIEIVFNAGRPYEDKKLASRSAASLLKEGTKSFTSAQIAETLDYYGDTLSIPVNLDTSNIVLYSLTKHLEKVMPILAEILSEPAYPEDELKSFIDRNKQRLQVDLARNDVVAYRKVTEYIFGDQHPYGYNSMYDTYDALSRADLVHHFEKNYVAENCMIFLSGKINKDIVKTINSYLGNSLRRGKKNDSKVSAVYNKPQQVFIPNEDSVQTAIRIGCQLFNQKHEDYKGLFVLNTILGGYFGSRLMTKIREEKGYTYNVYSTMDSMRFDGCFYVGTEVGNEFVEATKNQIYTEFETLQKELIEEDELSMVKNYLLGNLLTTLDGPFNVSDVIKTLVIEDLPFDDFQTLVHKIKTITAADLQSLAQKYLNRDQMWEVIVGKEK